jgi:predicted phosphoribosyltransferase
VVLALVRGGVPVGAAVAERLDLPLDILVARKIGLPSQPELAIGAMAGRVQVLDEHIIRALDVPRPAIARVIAREQAEMQRREALYRGRRPALEVQGRDVILVDDGLATGSTAIAAVRHLRSLGPTSITVAVPVGSRQACRALAQEADEMVCLETPEPFEAVGLWYRDFDQVNDAEVDDLLAHAQPR